MKIHGIELERVEEIPAILRGLPREHYLEVLIPKAGGKLIICENIGDGSHTYAGDEYVKTSFNRPTSMKNVVADIEDALEFDEQQRADWADYLAYLDEQYKKGELYYGM